MNFPSRNIHSGLPLLNQIPAEGAEEIASAVKCSPHKYEDPQHPHKNQLWRCGSVIPPLGRQRVEDLEDLAGPAV